MKNKSFRSDVNSIKITSKFWTHFRDRVAKSVIPYQWEVINDDREIAAPPDPGNGEKDQEFDTKFSHAVRNLEIAAGRKKGEFRGFVFQDSDVYKWLEEAAYAITYTNDPILKKLCDNVIDLIGDAQLKDGYLDTPFIIKSGRFKTRKRFTQIHQSHEMYTMGHFIEAGVAYYQSTGNEKALNIAKKMADCLYNNFGEAPGKIPGADGHPEIELALARLYEVTKEKKYLDLAKFFLTIRGKDPYFYDKQNAKIGNGSTDIFPIMRTWTHEYSLAARPITEQTQVVGHAVRAIYMITGVAHVGRLTRDKALIDTAHRLWKNIVNKRMYVTGAVGSTSNGEAFTYDYDLPNDIMYGESCASVAMTNLAARMMQLELKGEYGDIIEKELYNSAISGMSLDGKHFFYVNPLEADIIASVKVPARRHVMVDRAEWFTCACCPSNIARCIAGVHRYIYTINEKERTICAHQYIANNVTLFDGIKVNQVSNYPWDGHIVFNVEIPKGVKPINFVIRIPSFSMDKYSIKVNGKKFNAQLKDQLAYIPLSNGKHKIIVDLDMDVKFVRSKTHIRFDVGKVCVMRGPVVYCAESTDNLKPLWNYIIMHNEAKLTKVKFSNTLEGVIKLKVKAKRRILDYRDGPLYYDASKKVKYQNAYLNMIPYYAWNNRGCFSMLVWFDSDI